MLSATVVAGCVLIIYFIPTPSETAQMVLYYGLMAGLTVSLLLSIYSFVKEGYRFNTLEALVISGVLLYFLSLMKPG